MLPTFAQVGDAGDASMTDTPPYEHLTLLGHHASQPASPDDAILERVPNPAAGQTLYRALDLPRVHLPLPAYRAAGFRSYHGGLYS